MTWNPAAAIGSRAVNPSHVCMCAPRVCVCMRMCVCNRNRSLWPIKQLCVITKQGCCCRRLSCNDVRFHLCQQKALPESQHLRACFLFLCFFFRKVGWWWRASPMTSPALLDSGATPQKSIQPAYQVTSSKTLFNSTVTRLVRKSLPKNYYYVAEKIGFPVYSYTY